VSLLYFQWPSVTLDVYLISNMLITWSWPISLRILYITKLTIHINYTYNYTYKSFPQGPYGIKHRAISLRQLSFFFRYVGQNADVCSKVKTFYTIFNVIIVTLKLLLFWLFCYLYCYFTAGCLYISVRQSDLKIMSYYTNYKRTSRNLHAVYQRVVNAALDYRRLSSLTFTMPQISLGFR